MKKNIDAVKKMNRGQETYFKRDPGNPNEDYFTVTWIMKETLSRIESNFTNLYSPILFLFFIYLSFINADEVRSNQTIKLYDYYSNPKRNYKSKKIIENLSSQAACHSRCRTQNLELQTQLVVSQFLHFCQ